MGGAFCKGGGVLASSLFSLRNLGRIEGNNYGQPFTVIFPVPDKIPILSHLVPDDDWERG